MKSSGTYFSLSMSSTIAMKRQIDNMITETNNMVRELVMHREIKRTIAVTNEWRMDSGISFTEYIRRNIAQPAYTVQVLDTCNCCERHKINRPTKLEKYVEPPYNPDKIEIVNTCACPCRNISRSICRACVE